MSAATKAATKRAERERRRANGEKRVEVWLTKRQVSNLEWLMRRQGCDMREAIGMAIIDSVFAQDRND